MIPKFNKPVRKIPVPADDCLPDGRGYIQSKYTVLHVSHFYHVTYTIVLDQKLHPVGKADETRLLEFSKLMVRVLQGPDLYYGVIGNLFPNGEYVTVYPSGHDWSSKLSKLFKRRLLDWMEMVVLVENHTLEDVLDAYFAYFPIIKRPRKTRLNPKNQQINSTKLK
jgi:hypothetical protein